MANTLGTSPGVLIAQRALATILQDFPFLKLLTTDFSAEQGVLNQPLSVKLPVAFGAADDYNTSTGYGVSNASQIDAPLTLTRLVHKTYAFNDAERNSFNTNLIEGFARNAAHAVGMSLVNDLLALVTLDNFPNETVIAAGAMDRDAFIDANDELTGRKVPASARVALLNRDYAKGLSKDTIVVANAGAPRDTVVTGVIGVVDGVATHKYAQLPDNSESLAGLIAIPEALMISTRIPAPPQAPMPGTMQTVTDENTGLSVLLRQWYDPLLGKEYRSYSLLTGVAKGNTAGLERLVTAANES